MSAFPHYPKRKADIISNGVFLILLGYLFYTGQWWPGILFALGLTFAIRQYLTGRRLDFFLTVIVVGILGVITLAGHIFSSFFPLLLIAGGLYLVAKETLLFKKSPDHSNSSQTKE
jgi:hypothetical protein